MLQGISVGSGLRDKMKFLWPWNISMIGLIDGNKERVRLAFELEETMWARPR